MKRLYLKFERTEDLALYERLAKDAQERRYDLQTYILLVLLEAYRPLLSGTDAAVATDPPQ